jgi:RNA polymerase sigma factor (sigma-70 family)
MIAATAISFPTLVPIPAPSPRDEGSSEPLQSLTSFELVVRANAGDDPARDVLVARYLPRLQRWAHGRLPASARGAHQTMDLVQDTLFQVVRHLPKFNPRHEGAFQAYVRTTLWNRVKDLGRYTRRRPSDQLDGDFAGDGPSPIDEAIGAEALGRYEAGLDRLKPEERELIIARIEMGLPYKEMAEMFHKPSVPAVTMAVRRALVRLAEEMAHERRR